MANKKINELSSRVPSLSDLMIVGDPSSGYSYKCTVTALADIIETDIGDAFVTLSTTQTISGAKTFSNVITATSVANTPTDPDKFLTLNASNQVTYRTGTQVLSDIGGQGALTLTTTGTSGAATLVGNTLNIPQYTDQYTGTVTSVAMTVPTGLTVSGTPITSSGTLAVSLQSGYSIPTTASQANWDSAYNDKINSAAVTGTTTKTLTLTQQDGGTVTASWSDLNTDAVTSVFGRTGAVVATEGDYSLTQLSDVTITSPSNGQVLKYNGTTWVNDTDANTGTVTSVGLSAPTGFSVTNSPVTSSGTLTLSFASGYSLPTTASQTNWDTAYTNRITSLTTTGSSGAATLVSNTLNIPNYTLAGLGGVSGSGTTNYIPKFTSSSAIGNSQVYDNGTAVGIGTTSPLEFVHIKTASGATPLMVEYSGGAGTYILLRNNAGSAYLSSSTNDLVFSTSASVTERMRLTSTGLGIGTSSPAYKLDVSGTGSFSGYSSANQIPDIQITRSSSGTAIQTGPNITFTDGTTNNTTTLQVTQGRFGVWNYGAGFWQERMSIDASGNLGLGVTPSASSVVQLQVQNRAILTSVSNSTALTNNATMNSGYKYIATAASTLYEQDGGAHYWYNAPSGTAGNAITFTRAMTLFSTGNLAVGGTTDNGSRLNVTGAATFSSSVTATSFIASNGGDFAWGDGTTYIDGDASNQYIRAVVNNAERMRITSGGNVGIGTTSPQSLLNTASTGQVQIGTASWPTSFVGKSNARTLIGNEGVLILWNEATAAANNTAGMYLGPKGGGTNGSTTIAGGAIFGLSESASTNAGALTFHTNGGSGNAERMRITSGGDILVAGTYNPHTSANRGNITLNGTSGNIVAFTNNTTQQGYILHQAGELALFNQLNNAMTFGTNGSERMRITSGGNVRIVNGGDLEIYPSSGSSYTAMYNDNDNFMIWNNGSERMRINTNGELLINTTSDAGDYKLQVNGNIYGTGANLFTNTNPFIFNYNGNVDFHFSGASSTLRIINSSYSAALFSINQSGNGEFLGSIKTAAPSGGTAKPWKLGNYVSTAVTLDAAYIEVEIDGVAYKLATVYLP